MRRFLTMVIATSSLTACGGSPPDDSAVTVFAAASLTTAFTDLGAAFTAVNPEVEVVFNFAGSSALVAQIVEGAPADVFASADLTTMTTLIEADGTVGEPVVFTTNVAEIIVAPGNPKGITSVTDLARSDVVVVACASTVPCGRYAQQIIDRAGVTVTPRSLEEQVKAVAAKVILGEADAGIVYATDVLAAGEQAEGVPIPAEVNAAAQYPIAITREAPNPQGALAFVDFVLSAQGQTILESYGLVSP